MFEETLERLVVKSYTSMDGSMFQAFDAILEDAFEADTFDKVYEKIKGFFISDGIKSLYADKSESDILAEIDLLKPIAALYCCYFGMDYIYQKNTPQGEKLDFSYIKSFYDCSSDTAREVYNILRGSIGSLEKVKEFEDTLFVNPKGYQKKAENEMKDYFKSHIYLGNIKLYLDKACESDGKHLILRDLVPSITFMALRSSSSLPNGTYINRTKGYINVNAINTIDRWVLGQDFSKEIDLNINTFNVNKVRYKTSPEIAKLINLAVVDDVYRLDRLNTILINFVSYIEERKINENINESDIAMASSLLLSIPLPILPRYLRYLEKLFRGLECNDDSITRAMSKEIIRFTSVTFPYLIGLLCYLLFYRSYMPMPIEGIVKAVEKLEIFLQKNNNSILQSLSINDNRMWLYGESENSNKYIREYVDVKGKYKKDWKEKHEKSLGEVIEIILSPQINKFKISTLISKNFVALPTENKQKIMKFLSYSLYGIQSEKRREQKSFESEKIESKFMLYGLKGLQLEILDNHKMYNPEEYVLILVNDFLDNLTK
ncbi:MAG: hypothetical protein F8N38_10300 [Hungatella sp.]|nr:hypothetical protein [Hungatella sp.]